MSGSGDMILRTHRWYLRMLAPFVDGELPAGRETSVARHVDECAPCHGEFRLLCQMKRALRAVAAKQQPSL